MVLQRLMGRKCETKVGFRILGIRVTMVSFRFAGSVSVLKKDEIVEQMIFFVLGQHF